MERLQGRYVCPSCFTRTSQTMLQQISGTVTCFIIIIIDSLVVSVWQSLKPQVERRRRERMNRSLESLKTLLLQPQVKDPSLHLPHCTAAH